ncbi:hypothetical protein [Qingshengfaniella alkalisoli]|uniref:Uncharacterized protein n=1 Tax=Qingshengfaniella alkalisoli TaxID=2599296 RepID=A0A5B8IW25_9RHOB|nr:hypothetical protein [Qingshengfaniella alkalisoli]QDY69693.1 hypothetical protein FPZ52_08710 [Qingshengfaniella alkalisoli]
MDRTEFILAATILLFCAFCFGMLCHWMVTRLSRVSKAEIGELDGMAEALHEAEAQRDSALAEREATEARLRGRLAQTEAELRAAMDGLRAARAETQELQEYISRQNMTS